LRLGTRRDAAELDPNEEKQASEHESPGGGLGNGSVQRGGEHIIIHANVPIISEVVDPGGLRRVPKDSAYWYREVMAKNGTTIQANALLLSGGF
jgi:hypothetical protein